MRTFALALLFPAITLAQHPQGIVRESLTMTSEILDQDVRYTVYLPSDYETSERYYPIVYLLHGYTDDDTGWLQFGEANRIVDQGIADGDIPPMILLMPDGGVSWYINNYDNETRWEDMFVEEFIPHIESKYRVRAEKEFRGISGLSMGGYGSLVLSMRHPDLFVAAAAFSSGVVTDEGLQAIPAERWDMPFGALYGRGLEGPARLTEHWRRYSVLDIVREHSGRARSKRSATTSIAATTIFSRSGMRRFTFFSRKKKSRTNTESETGRTRGRTGGQGLPDGLKFIGESFHRDSPGERT